MRIDREIFGWRSRAMSASVAVVLLSGQALLAPHEGGAQALPIVPTEFQTVAVQTAGFMIEAPDDWAVIDYTRIDVQQQIDAIRSVDKKLVRNLSKYLDEAYTQGYVLKVIEPGTRHPGNLNVIMIPGVKKEPRIAEIKEGLGLFASDLEIEVTKVAGERSLKSTYTIEGFDEIEPDAPDVSGLQHTIEHNDNLYIFAFSAPVDKPHTKAFIRMAKSISFPEPLDEPTP